MGDAQRLFLVAHQPIAPRHDGDFGFASQIAGAVLVPQEFHRLGGRADEVDLAAPADFVEMGVLGEEAVAGVDRLDIANLLGGPMQIAWSASRK